MVRWQMKGKYCPHSKSYREKIQISGFSSSYMVVKLLLLSGNVILENAQYRFV